MAQMKNMGSIWRLLEENGGDVVLSGHDHHYERFHRLNRNGERVDDMSQPGMVQFVSGAIKEQWPSVPGAHMDPELTASYVGGSTAWFLILIGLRRSTTRMRFF